MTKKILSTIMLLVVVFAIATPVRTYACDCGCNCKTSSAQTVKAVTSKKKTDAFTKKTNELLKPVKKYGKTYCWSTETKVKKKTSSKQLTKVAFTNATTHYKLTVYIKATKKDGKVSAKWIFKRDGKWLKTTSTLVKEVLKEYGQKRQPVADPNPV